MIHLDAPWYWYIYLQNWVIYRVNVGKSSGTMEHMGMESEGKRWKTHETPTFLIMLPLESPSRESQPHFTARQVKSMRVQ